MESYFKGASEFEILVKTFAGFEDLLMEEIKSLGGTDVQPIVRGATCKGNLEVLYKLNLCARTAIKVLVPIESFTVANEDDLYNMVKKQPWYDWFTVDKHIMVESVVYSEVFTHSHYVALKTKDAIVDCFRDKYDERPSIDTSRPDIKIHMHIDGLNCTLLMDSSGSALFKRGYRTSTTRAPINEVVAAGLLLKAGYDGTRDFLDPMCGSGTFLIEAAMIASNKAPGIYRNHFAFFDWNGFDEALWEKLRLKAQMDVKEIEVSIKGSDIDMRAVEASQMNVMESGYDEDIKVSRKDMHDATFGKGTGLMVFNPPYGQRIGEESMMEELYAEIGDILKSNFQGCDAWIISSNLEALKKVGLRAARRLTIYNGALECKFQYYPMYRGSKEKK